MSEKITDFSLKHEGSSYSRNAENQVVSTVNFSGRVPVYGGVFGTLTFVENFNEADAKNGTCSWLGEAMLEDGTRIFGALDGTWSQEEGTHIYKITMEGEESTGRKTRSEGEIALGTLIYSGSVYTRN